MFDIQNYGSFVSAIAVFQLVPGPGMLAILNATARGGRVGGFCATGGTLLGDFVYMVSAVLGLAAVINAYPAAFEALQWVGAGYICWLGLRLLLLPVGDAQNTAKSKTRGQVFFRQAFTVGLSNPKVILFFLAFFPLFLRPDASPVTLVAMILHVSVISFLYQAALVLAGNAVARKLATFPSAKRVGSRLAGVTLVGFGIRLAANHR